MDQNKYWTHHANESTPSNQALWTFYGELVSNPKSYWCFIDFNWRSEEIIFESILTIFEGQLEQ